MAKDLGDFFPGAVIDFKFNTYSTTGAPITLAGSPVLAVYKGNVTTEGTAGITLTVDFDSRTGLHHVRITTGSDSSFYDFGNTFSVVFTAGTVDAMSVVGTEVATFTLGQAVQYVDAGVPQAVGSLTSTIRAAANFGADVLRGRTLLMWGSDQQYWVRTNITGNTGDVLTHEALAVVPSGTRYYVIIDGGGGGATPDAAAVRAAIGLASANMDTQLGTINTRIGAPVGASISADVAAVKVDSAAIKAKTDSLNFNVSGQVDANTRSMNGAAVIGNGTSGNRWRGA